MMNSKSGNWWIISKVDPRWNKNGHCAFCGGFEMPDECKAVFEQLKTQLGDPPSDLEWGYMKD